MTTDRASDIHVVPVNDLNEHDETRACWCLPVLGWDPSVVGEDGRRVVIVIHHSADGRELIEQHGVN